jgi:amino acid transporter
LTKNFTAFLNKKKDGTLDRRKFAEEFITGYIGIPLYLILFFAYKYLKKTKVIKPEEADLFTGKDIIDKEEEEFLYHQSLKGENASKFERMYDKTIGLIF